MTIGFHDKAHVDVGLEWGQMWLLDIASPEMQWEGECMLPSSDPADTHQHGQSFAYTLSVPTHISSHRAASVKRVLVARRKRGGNRQEGYRYRYFVRFPDRQYGSHQYHQVLEMEAMLAGAALGKRLFLTEVEAWEAYVGWLQRYLDRKRELVRVGQQMLVEAEGIVRLKRQRGER